MALRNSLPPPSVCPVCGAGVPEKALACPECGADHETGWNEEATAGDGLDLPETEFDYNAFVKREFGAHDPVYRSMIKVWMIVIFVVITIGLGLLFLWKWR